MSIVSGRRCDNCNVEIADSIILPATYWRLEKCTGYRCVDKVSVWDFCSLECLLELIKVWMVTKIDTEEIKK